MWRRRGGFHTAVSVFTVMTMKPPSSASLISASRMGLRNSAFSLRMPGARPRRTRRWRAESRLARERIRGPRSGPPRLALVKKQFVDAAVRAARIGFDVVELHIGHGYLLHEFVSPISNQRDDHYGGSLENRMRFPLEVFEAVRAALPKEIACGARITGTDWIDGGITPDEMVTFARELKSRGCAFVDVTSGQIDPRQKIPFAPGYNVGFARRAKQEAGITAMSVGMITRAQQAESIIAAGDADMVALARGAMDDPRWAWHAARELGAETAYPPNYQRCHPSVWQP